MDPGAVTAADFSSHLLAAMGTPRLNPHLKLVAFCQWNESLQKCFYSDVTGALCCYLCLTSFPCLETPDMPSLASDVSQDAVGCGTG